jgi:hypothetical protein
MYSDGCAYRKHIRDIHKLKLTPLQENAIYIPDMAENYEDPENRSCTICKRRYFNRTSYRLHVRTVHKNGKKMVPPPPVGKSRVNPDVQPDPNDPNFYCRSCKTTYGRKYGNIRHIRMFHASVLPASARPYQKNR